jgi:riboflavin synthase alpha subunit
LENLSPAALPDGGAQTVLAALEQQLAALDRLGAHIAAAHVDAAIQQMRRDQAAR